MKRVMIATLVVQALLPGLLPAQIANIAVTNAASFMPALPAAGSIGTIFCTGLRVTGTVSAPGVPLPLSLSGVTVTAGGVPAPLFAVADLGGYQQINFQVPQGIQIDTGTKGATVLVTVSQGGIQGTATAVPDSPQLGNFFRIGSTQYGIFQHAADYSLVTASNPARRGETIVGYATGLPAPIPPVPAGQPTPASPLYYVPQYPDPPNVSLTGLEITDSAGGVFRAKNDDGIYHPDGSLPFIGLTPGAIGLYQINFVVPSHLAAGDSSVGIWSLDSICNPLFGCSLAMYASQPVLVPVQ